MNIGQEAQLKLRIVKPVKKGRPNPAKDKIVKNLDQIKRDIHCGASILNLAEKYKIGRSCMSKHINALLPEDTVAQAVGNGKYNSSTSVSHSNSKRNKTA